jgi:tRNA nucleotidyltransferase (CCA-adding enzyme)
LFTSIPDYIAAILQCLGKNGYEAWLVGGCVRDMIMGVTPNDYDIATSALPSEIDELFDKTFLTGEKYGTVTVLFGGGKAEVTTYRTESGYDDFRRPSQVVFAKSVAEDLSRRDFTCNAIAYHSERGLYDPFLGKQAIENKTISAVGDANQRFFEDALRILRAFRFSAKLGFHIEPSTLNAAVKNRNLLEKISVERIKIELDKILLSDNPDILFEMINYGFLAFLFHSLNTSSIGIIAGTKKSLCTRWAAFFALTGYDGIKVMQALKFDNDTKHQVQLLLSVINAPLPQNRAEIKRCLLHIPPLLYHDALELIEAVKQTSTSCLQTELHNILESGEPYIPAMLAINGNDLIGSGFEQGSLIKIVLNRLLEIVIENPELNERSKLLKLAVGMKAGKS